MHGCLGTLHPYEKKKKKYFQAITYNRKKHISFMADFPSRALPILWVGVKVNKISQNVIFNSV